MKRIFKKNQIIITTLAIMIAIAGYLNYSGDKWTIGVGDLANSESSGERLTDEALESASAVEEGMLLDLSKEDLYASGEIFTDEIEQEVSADAETDESSDSVPGEAVLTSSDITTAITAQAKVNREQIRSKNKELLLEVINNVNIADAQKQAAIDAMIELTDIAEREAAAEMLLEAKGFSDVVVNIVDDTADVVVNMAQIDDAQRAQIEDIMKRKSGVSAENIVITPVE